MVAISKNEVLNLTTKYIKEFDLEESKHFNGIKEIINMHGDKPFYIFRYISFFKNFLIISKAGLYTIEIPSKIEHKFLEKLEQTCFIKIKNRRFDREILNSEFANEIYLTIDLHYCYFLVSF